MKNAKGMFLALLLASCLGFLAVGCGGGGGSSSGGSSSSSYVVGTWTGAWSITQSGTTSSGNNMILVFSSGGIGTYSNEGNPPDAITWSLSGSTVTIVFYNTACSISTATVAATVSGSTMTGSGSSGDCTSLSINVTKQS